MPVLLAQALYVRARALKMPEPDGARQGETGSGPLLRLLVLGDSSAAGVGVTTQDQALLGQVTQRLEPHARVQYELVARTGARTGDVLAWLNDLQSKKYDVVVLATGVNDVIKAVPLHRWLQQEAALLDRLTGELGARHVVISGLPPMHQFPLLPQPLRWMLGRQASRFDRHLRQMVADRPCCHMLHVPLDLDPSNMAPDGFHPGANVYALWAQLICDTLLAEPTLLDPACATA